MRVVAVGAVCVAVVVLLALVLGAGTGRAVEERERASATNRPAAVAGVAGRSGPNAARVSVVRPDALVDALASGPAACAHDASLPDRALHPAAVSLVGCGRPATTYTYDVVVRGEVVTDPRAFAERAATILADERGWASEGELGFGEVADGGDVTLVLASPDAVAAAHPICGRRFSCRVGDEVMVNDRAWRDATPAFRRAGGDLATYRRYVLQHELGHWLGYGHRECPRAGAAAPVMQQQSISLDGCTPQGWPLAEERSTYD